jgi:transposase-like protein
MIKIRNRKQFTEEQKLKIVNKIGKTITKSKLARDYNIAYSTLRKWELMFLSSEKNGKEPLAIELAKRKSQETSAKKVRAKDVLADRRKPPRNKLKFERY